MKKFSLSLFFFVILWKELYFICFGNLNKFLMYYTCPTAQQKYLAQLLIKIFQSFENEEANIFSRQYFDEASEQVLFTVNACV